MWKNFQRAVIRVQIHVRLLHIGKTFNGRAVKHAVIVERLLKLPCRDRQILQVAGNVRKLESDKFYVLLLDQGVSRKKGTWLAQYKDPESWRGIDSITDDTPGFKPILSDGEMRLYEIE